MAAREVALVEIKAIHAEVKERYGNPRIHQELKKRGFKTNLNTVAKIMRKNHIRARNPQVSASASPPQLFPPNK